MNLFERVALLSAFGTLVACAPLQQAPLVYSSKVSIGVDVSATSTETPGVGINVGYKQIDAAYVPVAVARKCEPALDKSCTDKTYDLVLLNGDSQLADGEEVSPAKLVADGDAAANAAAKLNHAQGRLEEATRRHQADKVLADSVNVRQEKLALLKATGIPAQAAVDQAQADVLSATDARDKLPARLDALNAAKVAMDIAAQANIAASQKYQGLLENGSSRNLNGKKDAFSVFGSFTADTNTKAAADKSAGVSLSLGKIFSTGVASQHLTEGMARFFANASPGACFDKAAAIIQLLPQADWAAAAKAAMTACTIPVPHG